jgi:hypothetical protein
MQNSTAGAKRDGHGRRCLDWRGEKARHVPPVGFTPHAASPRVQRQRGGPATAASNWRIAPARRASGRLQKREKAHSSHRAAAPARGGVTRTSALQACARAIRPTSRGAWLFVRPYETGGAPGPSCRTMEGGTTRRRRRVVRTHARWYYARAHAASPSTRAILAPGCWHTSRGPRLRRGRPPRLRAGAEPFQREGWRAARERAPPVRAWLAAQARLARAMATVRSVLCPRGDNDSDSDNVEEPPSGVNVSLRYAIRRVKYKANSAFESLAWQTRVRALRVRCVCSARAPRQPRAARLTPDRSLTPPRPCVSGSVRRWCASLWPSAAWAGAR